MAWRAVLVILVLMVAAIFVAGRLAPPPERRAPAATGPGEAERGARLFRDHCAICHGSALQGTDRGPPLLHAVYKPGHHADLAIRLAVRNGVVQHHWHFGNMPPVPAVAEETEHLVAFIRREQRRAGLIDRETAD